MRCSGVSANYRGSICIARLGVYYHLVGGYSDHYIPERDPNAEDCDNSSTHHLYQDGHQ